MVTLTLIQGVVNTFVVFLSRIIGSIVDRTVFRTERGTGPGYFITVMVRQIVFGVLASIIVAWFSRRREFRRMRVPRNTWARRRRWSMR
jgi:heat shock protein HtpX